jgi:hypothetical protein
MILSELIYAHSDTCVDIYYSAHHSELLLGARRLTHDNQLVRDYLVRRLVAWPSNKALGKTILEELERSGQRIPSSDPVTNSNRVSLRYVLEVASELKKAGLPRWK